MRRFLVTILSILYMASALSMTVHAHYCMGKLANLSLFHSDEDKCGKCGMKKGEMKKGCCKDDHKTLKTNDHQQAKISFDFSHQLFTIQQHSIYLFQDVPASLGNSGTLNLTNSPPSLWRSSPIYMLNQDYRI